jgi:hypothetical protein
MSRTTSSSGQNPSTGLSVWNEGQGQDVNEPDPVEPAMRKVQAEALKAPEAAYVEREATHLPPPIPTTAATPGLLHIPHLKGTKSANELAAMIVADLREVDGCPKAGVNVTVYGSNPWNSWLSFGSAAGPVPNKSELQEFCDIITGRLKRLYNVRP